MRRVLAVLLIVTCMLTLMPSAAHAGGHGAARAVVGLATFVILAPFIIAGEILAFALPPYRVPAVVVAPPPASPAPSPAYSAPPPAYSAPPVYYSPPAYTASPAYPRQSYAAPVRPSVIQFPQGRYELQGDGIATAYQWVWIANPTNSASPLGAQASPPAASQ